MKLYTKNSYVGGYFVAFKNELLDSIFILYNLQNENKQRQQFWFFGWNQRRRFEKRKT